MVYSSALPRASLSSSIKGALVSRGEQQQEEQQRLAAPPAPVRRLPRQRWQWSKGDGPGEYGGPPLDFRIRKFWGEDVPDPVTSTDGYIWNKKWQPHLPPLDEEDPPSAETISSKQPEAGFLSLNRSISLDSMQVDLTKELVTPSKSMLAPQVEAHRGGQTTDEAIWQDKPRWRMAPTRREQQQWARGRKAGGMAMLVSEGEDGSNGTERQAITVKKDYPQLKGNLQILTAIFGAAGMAVTYASYSSEVAFSYGVGLIGALAYIRMLGSSVDSLGQSTSKGAVRAALGQPRLLVPVVLVMLFNRWNEIIAPEYNVLHLQLIPMLIGFFTYKAATVVEVFRDLYQPLSQEESL